MSTATESDDRRDSHECKDDYYGDYDSYGDYDLAYVEEVFGSKEKKETRSCSITSVARPGLEHETLSHHWIRKSKQGSGSRNFFAKKMLEPSFLIITHSKWMEYVFYTVFAICIQLTFGRSSFFPNGKPAGDTLNGMAERNATLCDFIFACCLHFERLCGEVSLICTMYLHGFAMFDIIETCSQIQHALLLFLFSAPSIYGDRVAQHTSRYVVHVVT